MTPDGRREIAALVARHRVRVASVTGDCFMQAPFWKESGAARAVLVEEMLAVCAAGAALGAGVVVVPLVDNGGLANRAQEDGLVATLLEFAPRLTATLAFESDYAPAELARFIARLPASRFGINYDIGNSASLGYAPAAEIAAYGGRIVNVHVKDRKRGGTTVPLGTGDADLVDAIARIERLGYGGGYVLQTARADDGDDVGAATRYRDMTAGWIAGARRAA
jgi:hexulose-6-phosphate isomerase